jgi:hypothetical protein
MSTVTIALPDPLDAALRERMTAVGAHSKEEYLLALIESDCAASELERVLVDRLAGPFEPLETDWKERVRQANLKKDWSSKQASRGGSQSRVTLDEIRKLGRTALPQI